MNLFGLLSPKMFAPPAAKLFVGEQNESQKRGGVIEMHNTYPWTNVSKSVYE